MGTEIILSYLAIGFLWLCGAACAVGVLWEPIKDTLAQRIALAGMCAGFISIAGTVMRDQLSVGPIAWFSGFAALFALETLRLVLFTRGPQHD
jgi:hypothetical protein